MIIKPTIESFDSHFIRTGKCILSGHEYIQYTISDNMFEKLFPINCKFDQSRQIRFQVNSKKALIFNTITQDRICVIKRLL